MAERELPPPKIEKKANSERELRKYDPPLEPPPKKKRIFIQHDFKKQIRDEMYACGILNGNKNDVIDILRCNVGIVIGLIFHIGTFDPEELSQASGLNETLVEEILGNLKKAKIINGQTIRMEELEGADEQNIRFSLLILAGLGEVELQDDFSWRMVNA